MDNKRLILAVAGSGKTYHIVEQLDEQKRALLITYTLSGTDNLISEVIKKFGYLPENIKIYNYFSFLYSFCYKPFLKDEINDNGISWKYPTGIYNQQFLTQSKYLYHNRIAKLLCQKVITKVRNRIEKYFEYFLVDEVQDFAGHDFNFLIEIAKCNIEILFVGDFYQHTFDTSRDKQTKKSLHSDINNYISHFTKAGLYYNPKTLIKSRRCSKNTCEFIKNRLGIDIESESDANTECRLVTDDFEALSIFKDDNIVKLFLQKHYTFKCKSDNWGSCKGLTYENVCVVLNPDTLRLFNSTTELNFASTITKNKFYVACSRARKNLYFVPDTIFKKWNNTQVG